MQELKVVDFLLKRLASQEAELFALREQLELTTLKRMGKRAMHAALRKHRPYLVD